MKEGELFLAASPPAGKLGHLSGLPSAVVLL